MLPLHSHRGLPAVFGTNSCPRTFAPVLPSARSTVLINTYRAFLSLVLVARALSQLQWTWRWLPDQGHEWLLPPLCFVSLLTARTATRYYVTVSIARIPPLECTLPLGMDFVFLATTAPGPRTPPALLSVLIIYLLSEYTHIQVLNDKYIKPCISMFQSQFD